MAVDPPHGPSSGVTLHVACPRPQPAALAEQAARVATAWAFTVPGPGSAPGPAPHLLAAAQRALVTRWLVLPCGDDPAALLRAYAPVWAVRHGAQVVIEEYDAGGEPPADADVWVIAPCQLPHAMESGKVVPLPASLQSRDNPYQWSDLLPFYREQLLAWDQKAGAVPLLGEGLVCCYRADWFADPAARSAFRHKYGRDLGAPATWEELAQAAAFFRDRAGAPSLPPLPSDNRALDRLFYTAAACYARRAVPMEEKGQADERLDEIFSFHYDLKTGKPRIAAPGFVQALRLLQELQLCRPGGAQAVPELAFLQGRAALCLADAAWVAFFQREPALRDRVGVCRVPGADRYFAFATGQEQRVSEPNRVPYLGGAGWLAVVSSRSAQPHSAVELLAEVTGPSAGGQVVLAPRWGGGPVRDSQLRRQHWDSYALHKLYVPPAWQEHVPPILEIDPLPRLKQALRDELGRDALKNPVLCLRTPTEAPHREALDRAVRQALLQGGDAGAALKDVERRWLELDAKQDREAVQADYRRSLGLLSRGK
jgi:ABC-type glycerol-3-phosphate transport system substrate-binding protein